MSRPENDPPEIDPPEIDRPEIDRSGPPAPQAPRDFAFPPTRRLSLADGLQLLTARMPRLPMVRLDYLCRGGAQNEPAGAAGLATLTAGLMDEGTRRSTSTQLARRMERLGGQLSTGAGWNAATLSVTVLSKHLRIGLETLAELVLEADFPEAEVERLRRQRLDGLLQDLNQPRVLAERCLNRALYGEAVYGTSLLGTRESVQTLCRDDAVRFYRHHYGLGRATVTAVGDLDPDELRDRTTALFAGEPLVDPPGGGNEAAPPAVGNRRLEGREVHLVDRAGAAQTELRIAHVGTERRNPDFQKLQVLNSILGGKFTSRLNLNLRERHGYTYGAQSRFVPRHQAAPFVISTAVATDVAGAAAREALGELERICEERVTAEELSDASSFLRGIFVNHLQTIDDLVARLSTLAIFGLTDDYFTSYLEEVAAVGVDDVLELAQRYLQPRELVIVAIGPREDLLPQLEELGPVRMWSPDELI